MPVAHPNRVLAEGDAMRFPVTQDVGDNLIRFRVEACYRTIVMVHDPHRSIPDGDAIRGSADLEWFARELIRLCIDFAYKMSTPINRPNKSWSDSQAHRAATNLDPCYCFASLRINSENRI